MQHRCFVGLTLAAWAACAGLLMAQQPATPAGADQTAVFRGGVELMNLSVTVTDKKGRSVTDLTQDDFQILEDKKPQAIVNFSSAKQTNTTPIGLGLVLDASLSMTADRLQSMRTAVELMLNNRLRKDDEMYVVEFNKEAKLTREWTTDKKSVIDTVRRIKTHVAESMKGLGEAHPPEGGTWSFVLSPWYLVLGRGRRTRDSERTRHHAPTTKD